MDGAPPCAASATHCQWWSLLMIDCFKVKMISLWIAQHLNVLSKQKKE